MTATGSGIVVLCGGVGAAKFLRGLIEVTPASDVLGIVNTGDDLVLHGLSISPDLDTCTYTLADEINPKTGWGMTGETWHAMETLQRLGGVDWFNLGDRDLGTHLYRTQRRNEGAPLSAITAEIGEAMGVPCGLVPMTDDAVATWVTTKSHGRLSFQEYFVKHHHSLEVTAVGFAGADSARPAPGVIDAIASASQIIIAPSNPLVSIGPMLAISTIAEALRERRSAVTAISPIVGGKALKGPADRLLRELGYESSVAGVLRVYREFIGRLIIDEADADQSEALAGESARDGYNVGVCVLDTVMSNVDAAARLATDVLALGAS